MAASENGWQPAQIGPDRCEWVTVPGTTVSLQLMKGWPLAVMRALAADFNAFVEPLRDPDSASWTPTNSVATSNHLNATAMDLNWGSHPFHARGTFNPGQMRTIRELLAFYEDTIFWAGDWNNPVDEMHWQMGYNSYNNPRTSDFIRRKIRPDGFSTFRRGQNLPPTNGAQVLADAVGVPFAKALEILPAVRDGLQRSNAVNVNRVAMWLAQIGHESAGFNATEEYQSGDESQERWLYKGRTWIQITWRSNYEGFSRWCFEHGLVPSPSYFVDRPRELADLKWAGLGPAWYWTVARPDINALSDSRNLEAVTRQINGGINGLDDRRRRYNLALSKGDALLVLIENEGDELTPEQDRMLRTVFEELTKKFPSRSIYRTPGEGLVDSSAGFGLNVDGMVHRDAVESGARLGDLEAIGRIARVAAGEGAVTDQWAVDHAKAVLRELSVSNPAALQTFLSQKEK